jgi:hypothetical protein
VPCAREVVPVTWVRGRMGERVLLLVGTVLEEVHGLGRVTVVSSSGEVRGSW